MAWVTGFEPATPTLLRPDEHLLVPGAGIHCRSMGRWVFFAGKINSS